MASRLHSDASLVLLTVGSPSLPSSMMHASYSTVVHCMFQDVQCTFHVVQCTFHVLKYKINSIARKYLISVPA